MGIGKPANFTKAVGMEYRSIATDQITIDNTAGGVALTKIAADTASIRSKVAYAVIYNTTAQIRFFANGDASTAIGGYAGTAPTSTKGNIMEIGDEIEVWSIADLINFRAIRTGAVSGILEVEYFGTK